MYAGHFATALALKTATPKAPTWALAAGCGLMDIVFGALVAARVEGFAPDFRTSHLLVIPWSHSLLSAILLGIAFAAPFWRRGFGVVLTLFAAVVSHWLLDVLVHRPDMQLWPHAPISLGYVSIFGPVSGWGESALVLACVTLYALAARNAQDYGRHRGLACALMLVMWLMGLSAG